MIAYLLGVLTAACVYTFWPELAARPSKWLRDGVDWAKARWNGYRARRKA